MELSWMEFVIIALATFRFTHLIVFDKITNFLRKPFQMIREEEMSSGEVFEFVSPRGKGIRRFIGELLSCYWCSGLWVAILFALLFWWVPTIMWPIFIVLAIAGVASFLEALLKG
ncbi:Sporulation protein yjcA [Alkalihalobacillus alcalophilus ATCC 27647 = CGMCC 1.3604]|uniref:Sporulation protein n=1 Tax=Alkalihalobacillus alcalophilus ATCC 27647 = CGMCC 1.3604 TaxID=1218173 RepID=A0A094WKE9_ALKAL|nr:DUF1360 domain-containing protein [Alkalihalobacillus alcalophilus]KGA97311.1 sporulation protein [Alkalihalobacillus alcalophilus ATCC 27647 = CGMCC 1.3604]MED1562511.1 DUF1360 domain-containing protein [Alkalihalobacillus alcalophilus]THG92150.1 Sporulation protein yjcA [Alkalihalobacillus alcalophilus ATCC 27647 = CGMCC 1.3604]